MEELLWIFLLPIVALVVVLCAVLDAMIEPRKRKLWGENEEHLTSVDEVVSRAKTGDLILFQGTGISSWLIRFMSVCKVWSHVGVVVVHDGRKCITEAYNEVISEDLLRGGEHSGVQFVDLETRLRTYPGGRLAYRPISGTVSPTSVDLVVEAYKRLDFSLVPRYNRNLWDFIEYGSRSDNDSNVHNGVKHYVCTAWVAQVLILLGVCSDRVAPGNYLLSDYGLTYRQMSTLHEPFKFGDISFIVC
jgi:hypothetical protein